MEMNLCLGCFDELQPNEKVCPKCGYEVGTLAQEPYHLAPGSVLHGRYLIGRALGSGGFGVTYKAMDLVLNQKVAIKEYLPSDFSTRMPGALTVSIYSGESEEQFIAGLNRYLEEAQRLAALKGIPGVVQIMDYFQDNNTAYIVMELLEGETLKQRLKEKGKLTYDEAALIMLPVLNTLEAVHTQTWDKEKKSCIIHRDVSPDNIFLTGDGQVKLLDFGAARYASTYHSKSLSVILKPGYAPEEQYRSRGNQGPWSDVYGAAATFYKVLTGITPEDAMERLNHDDLKDPRKLGVKMTENQENALMNALNVKAENRTQSAGEFAEDLLCTSPVLRNLIRTKQQDEGKMPLWIKFFVGAVGATVLALIALIAFGVLDPNPSNWRNQVPAGMTYVPRLINLDAEEANEKADDNKLKMTSTGSEFSTKVPEGMVMSQNPSTGRLITFGDEIYVTISAGAEQIQLSDVEYMDMKMAKELLEESGFVVVLVSEENTDFAEGTVIKQDLIKDKLYDKGTVITLTYATGAKETDEDVEVPDLSKKTLEEAQKELRKLGLYIVKGKMIVNENFPDKTIVTQSVPAGDTVKKGSAIIVQVNELNGVYFMPYVLSKDEETATSMLLACGISADNITYIEKEDKSVQEGHVISQSIPANTQLKHDDKVTLYISTGYKALVPNVNGKSQEDAVKTLESATFRVTIVEQYSFDVAKGQVISTNPAGGSEGTKEGNVVVYVSKGPDPTKKMITTPNVLNYSSADAKAKMEQEGFTVAFAEAYSETVAAGQVCAQSVAPGSSVGRGTSVTLTISKGTEYVNLPDLSGQTQAGAISILNSLGLSVSNSVSTYNDGYSEGLVCSQMPTAGSVKRGTGVTIYISLGPQNINVPNVTGMSASAAINTITGAGLPSPTISYNFSESYAWGSVTGYTPSGSVSRNTQVTVYVSIGTAGKDISEAELGNYPSNHYNITPLPSLYRYKVSQRETTQSNQSSLSGWTETGSTQTSPTYGPWQTSNPGGEYETKTVYLYYTYTNAQGDWFNSSSNASFHGCTTPWNVYTDAEYPWSSAEQAYVTPSSFSGYIGSYSNAGWSVGYFWRTSATIYRSKTPGTTTYYYERWVSGGWTGWSTSQMSATSNLRIEQTEEQKRYHVSGKQG